MHGVFCLWLSFSFVIKCDLQTSPAIADCPDLWISTETQIPILLSVLPKADIAAAVAVHPAFRHSAPKYEAPNVPNKQRLRERDNNLFGRFFYRIKLPDLSGTRLRTEFSKSTGGFI